MISPAGRRTSAPCWKTAVLNDGGLSRVATLPARIRRRVVARASCPCVSSTLAPMYVWPAGHSQCTRLRASVAGVPRTSAAVVRAHYHFAIISCGFPSPWWEGAIAARPLPPRTKPANWPTLAPLPIPGYSSGPDGHEPSPANTTNQSPCAADLNYFLPLSRS